MGRPMSILRLVWMEIWHRKLTFTIGLLTVTVAVAYAVCSLVLVRAQQIHTEQRVAKLDNEIRKITKAMGFNINVLPADLNLADFFATDFAGETMPYEFVERLVDSPSIESIRHLRPALVRKVNWPEYDRQVVLMGVTGVAPLTHVPNPKKPLAKAIPAGTMNLGAELAKQIGLQAGDDVELHGHALKVNQVDAPRGSVDDITVYVTLDLAQAILDLPGRITLIQALECNCATIDRLAEIQQEISDVLGSDVQVIEIATTAIARAKSRETVRKEGELALVRMRDRVSLQIIVLTVAGILLLGMLTLANVRERRDEIGILRALGLKTSTILRLFLTKAIVVGFFGAVFGITIGYLVANWLEYANGTSAPLTFSELYWPQMTYWIAILTPILTLIASWVPTVQAANQDPASVLTAE